MKNNPWKLKEKKNRNNTLIKDYGNEEKLGEVKVVI